MEYSTFCKQDVGGVRCPRNTAILQPHGGDCKDTSSLGFGKIDLDLVGVDSTTIKSQKGSK